MDKEVILSICIPTYNRKERVKKLILELLKSGREDYEVVVLDNASTDGTYEELKKIDSKKLKIFRQEKLVSAVYNGLMSLTLGKGKYSMQFNDRELINIEYLDEILNVLKEHNFSFIKFESNKKKKGFKYINKKGIEAKKKIDLTGYHPTGLTFNREILKKINIKDYISYEKVGILQSHFFLVYDLLQYGDVGFYYTKFWEFAEEKFKEKNKSGYQDFSKPLWFSPEGMYGEICRISNHIILDKNINKKLKEYLLKRVIKSHLKKISFDYVYHFSNNVVECRHYGIEPTYLGYQEFKKISDEYTEKYFKFLEENFEMTLGLKLTIFFDKLKTEYKARKRG